jgi:hypothetical protein
MSNTTAKWRQVILIAIAVASVVALLGYLLWQHQNPLELAVKETRETLRKEGFKTDLADFDFSAPESASAFDKALTAFDPRAGMRRPPAPGAAFTQSNARTTVSHIPFRVPSFPLYMIPATTNSAVVVWKQDFLEYGNDKKTWDKAVEAMDLDMPGLEKLQASALGGPIRFSLDNKAGMAMLLPHLAPLKIVQNELALCSMINLRKGDTNAAWTNLLALTRMVTAYDVEPVLISQMLRDTLATTAFNATWQALQAEGWQDEQLARLQQEWESADFFKSLPATEEFNCAIALAACRTGRGQSMFPGSFWDFVRYCAQNPGFLIQNLQNFRSQADYKNRGSYVDEKNLMLFYRDRKNEMIHAVACSNWQEMSLLPGVLKPTIFSSTNGSSRFQGMMNIRMMNTPFSNFRRTLPAIAAEAEARRRIIITALALERHHLRHGSYPDSMNELVPEFLKQPPTDFMDGKPLRYKKTGDGHFALYSVGLDGIDDGGRLELRRKYSDGLVDALTRSSGIGGVGSANQNRNAGGNIVWPRPATAEEVASMDAEEMKAELEAVDQSEQRLAEARWESTAERQAKAESLLSSGQTQSVPDPVFQGQHLSEILHNAESNGTNMLSMTELLTLHQVITGGEPEKATFELPIRYDALKSGPTPGFNMEFRLLVDGVSAGAANDEPLPSQTETARATNGNTQLILTALFESPGKHAVQADLIMDSSDSPVENKLQGPFCPFSVSNLCQFSPECAHFDPRLGATFRAKLAESNGAYSADMVGSDGKILKTFNEATSNGIIKFHWNLVDDHGQKYTNENFDSVFRITLPDSGRTQTLRGP